jgi:hypothetical protein
MQPAFEEVIARSIADARNIPSPPSTASSSVINYSLNTAASFLSTDNHKSSSSLKPNVINSNGTLNGTSTADDTNGQTGMAQWAKKQELKRRIAEMDADILGIKEGIKSLNAQLSSRKSQKEGMVRMLLELERDSRSGAIQSAPTFGSGSKGINYMDGVFDWMGGLKSRMKTVFGINDFRHCQRGYGSAVPFFPSSDHTSQHVPPEYAMPIWTGEILLS